MENIPLEFHRFSVDSVQCSVLWWIFEPLQPSFPNKIWHQPLVRKWYEDRWRLTSNASIPQSPHAKSTTKTTRSSQSREEKIHRPPLRTKREVQRNLSLTFRAHRSEACRRESTKEVQRTLSRWRRLKSSKRPERRLESQRNFFLTKRFNNSRITRTRTRSKKIWTRLKNSTRSSKKSKELTTSMGNTEFFALLETSSKIQSPDCAVFWEVGVICCTCGK